MNFGEYVSNYCSSNDMTIAQFAKKSGINRSYIHILKTSGRHPGLDTLKKAADAMGIDCDDLLSQIDYKRPKVYKVAKFLETPVYDATDITSVSRDNISEAIMVPSKDGSHYIAFKNPVGVFNPYGCDVIVVAKVTNRSLSGNAVALKYGNTIYCGKYYSNTNGQCLVPFDPQVEMLSLGIRKNESDLIVYGNIVEIRFQFGTNE